MFTYMTKMMLMFSLIILVGLFLTWVHDVLESLFNRFQTQPAKNKITVPSLQSRQLVASPIMPKVRAIAIPAPARMAVPLSEAAHHDYAGKIVKIDLAPRSRPSRDEHGDKLGEHVTVLPKAA